MLLRIAPLSSQPSPKVDTKNSCCILSCNLMLGVAGHSLSQSLNPLR